MPFRPSSRTTDIALTSLLDQYSTAYTTVDYNHTTTHYSSRCTMHSVFSQNQPCSILSLARQPTATSRHQNPVIGTLPMMSPHASHVTRAARHPHRIPAHTAHLQQCTPSLFHEPAKFTSRMRSVRARALSRFVLLSPSGFTNCTTHWYPHQVSFWRDHYLSAIYLPPPTTIGHHSTNGNNAVRSATGYPSSAHYSTVL